MGWKNTFIRGTLALHGLNGWLYLDRNHPKSPNGELNYLRLDQMLNASQVPVFGDYKLGDGWLDSDKPPANLGAPGLLPEVSATTWGRFMMNRHGKVTDIVFDRWSRGQSSPRKCGAYWHRKLVPKEQVPCRHRCGEDRLIEPALKLREVLRRGF